MEKDLSSIIEGWDFDPGDICARKIAGVDGPEKLQVRLDLGLLQMELKGRPDGSRFRGHETVLHYYRNRLHGHEDQHGSDGGFRLGGKACSRLWQERVQYYHRYICLLRLEDYKGVVCDTAHDLAIFDLVNRYADDDKAKLSFEQYRPYVIMIHSRAEGEICLKRGNYEGAIQAASNGIDKIRSFFEAFGDPELIEASEELQALEAWGEELRNHRPKSMKQQLSQRLTEAIAEEKYEQAARIRDRLQGLEGANF